LFPGFRAAEKVEPAYALEARADVPFVDDWGCLWKTTESGITGTVTMHPLADWANFEGYYPPNPEFCSGIGPLDWEAEKKEFERLRKAGGLLQGGLRHGHTFLQICDIRGYENVLVDMATNEPRLTQLIEMVEAFNMAIVKRYIELGAEWMGYPEDLGMQRGPMLSPKHFRQFIRPVFTRLMEPAREAGCVIHMHSDGDIRLLAEDLLECGVDVLNLQDLVNGVDWIAENLAGRVCVHMDIDRANVTCFGTPGEIDKLIREEVEKVGRKEGGLMMIYGLYPGVPLENAAAVMDAMERYAFYYS
jgi:hypothetical protein